MVAGAQGDYGTSRILTEESLALYQKSGDQLGMAVSLNNLGVIARNLGEYPRARTLFEETHTLRRALGDKRGIALALSNLATVGDLEGDYFRARDLLEQSLQLERELGNKPGIARALCSLGVVAGHLGDASARTLLAESLQIGYELGDKATIVNALEGLADLAVRDRAAYAVRLFGAAGALREALGTGLPPSDQGAYERNLSSLRAALGDTAFAELWAEGRAMPLDHVVQYAPRI